MIFLPCVVAVQHGQAVRILSGRVPAQEHLLCGLRFREGLRLGDDANVKVSHANADNLPRDLSAFFSERLGLPVGQFPHLNNGAIRRAAGVDIATYHNWVYRGGDLPESALKKLDDFFRGIAGRGEDN